MDIAELSLSELPAEMLYHLLRFCSIQSLGRLSQVNKYINLNCQTNSIWVEKHPEPTSSNGILVASKFSVENAKITPGYMKFHLKVFLSESDSRICPCCIRRPLNRTLMHTEFSGTQNINRFCSTCRSSFPGLTLRIDFQDAKKLYHLDDDDVERLRAIVEPMHARSLRSKGSLSIPVFVFEFFVRRYAILKYGSMEEICRRSLPVSESSDREMLRSSKGKRKRTNSDSHESDIISLRKSRGDVGESNLDPNNAAAWPLWIPGSNFQL